MPARSAPQPFALFVGATALLCLVVLLFTTQQKPSSFVSAAKTQDEEEPDIVTCDACVGVVKEMCAGALKHRRVITDYEQWKEEQQNEKKEENEDNKKSKKKAKRRAPKKPQPMEVALADLQEEICSIDHMRRYVHPPPVLVPRCEEFASRHEDEITSFFGTFHQTIQTVGDKSATETACNDAAEVFCKELVPVCTGYDVKDIKQSAASDKKKGKKNKKNKKQRDSAMQFMATSDGTAGPDGIDPLSDPLLRKGKKPLKTKTRRSEKEMPRKDEDEL